MARQKKTRDSGAQPARVLVVDDHPIARLGLVQLLEHEPDLTVCAEAKSAADAMQAIPEAQPDIAIVDISMEGRSGLELIKDIAARFESLPILVLSIHDEELYAERALRAGARGYIMKEEAAEEVVAAIRRVLSGEVYLSENMARRALRKMLKGGAHPGTPPLELLTDRELQVFELIGRGLGTRQIAGKLQLSVKTVEIHQGRIKSKLDLGSATALLRHAVLWVQHERAP